MSLATPLSGKEAQSPDALQGPRWWRESRSVALGETGMGDSSYRRVLHVGLQTHTGVTIRTVP